jgi:uncharacterized protein (DUF58 family)
MHNIFWALIILVLIAALLRMDWVYYLVYVVGGLWIFSHWWVRRSLGQLQVQRQMVHHAFPGEKLTATVQMRNRSWLPLPWLHIQELVPFELQDEPHYRTVVSVPSRGQTEHRYTLRCTKRGYYTVGPLRLDTGDLFGFVSTSWQETEPTHVTVYPQVVTLDSLGLPSRSPFGSQASHQRIFEDPTRLAGTREYMTGDSMRNIHWKASAHEDTLLVKKFQPAISLNVQVVLDLNRNAYPMSGAIGSSEWAITVAASMASHIIVRQREQVGLITNGLDPFSDEIATAIPTRSGRGHLMSILSLLARIQMHEVESELADWLPRQLANLEWGTTLVVVTPQLSERAIWSLHNAYRRGSNVMVLLCAPDPDFQLMQARAERLGVIVHRTVWERELHMATQRAA